MFRRINLNFIIIVLIILIVSCISFIAYYYNTTEFAGGKYYYELSENDIANLDQVLSYEELLESSVAESEFYANYIDKYEAIFIMYSFGGLMILVVAILVIILIMDNYFKKQVHIAVSKLLNNSDKFDFWQEEWEPLINKFVNMKLESNNMEQQMNMLKSYVTHEQKNSLHVLRAGIETDVFTKNDQLLEIDHIADNFDDILTLATASDINLNTDVDLLLIIAKLVDKYRVLHSNIQLVFDEEVDYVIKGDLFLLERCFSNLLDNAIKYRTSSNDRIEIKLYCTKTSINIEIKDQGIGIDDELINEIFSYSYRVPTLNNDGYGIGLNLVLKVVDLCEGIIMCAPNSDIGITIKIAFPL